MKKEKDKMDKIVEILLDKEKPITHEEFDTMMSELSQKLVQATLEAELTTHLKYTKNSKEMKETDNRRNGYSSKNKKIKTSKGEIFVDMPRDRDGSFEPMFVKKRQRILDKLENVIMLMYAKGITQRDIAELLKEQYGSVVSPQYISNVIQEVWTEVEAWQSRELKKFYPFVYVDCLYVPVKEDLVSEKKAVYVMLGVDLTGHKEVMGIWLGEENAEGAYFWNRIFSEIKERGVEDILIVSLDGLKGLTEAIEAVFPKTQTQRCIVHLVRNLAKKCNKKEMKEVIGDFKKIYKAPTVEVAKLELDNFNEKYKNKKEILKTVERYIEYILPLYEFPQEIRKIIYTTNPIESLNSALRKVTRGKGSFVNKEALMKVLYLRVNDLEKKWTKGMPNWEVVLNQLIQIYGERVTKYLNI